MKTEENSKKSGTRIVVRTPWRGEMPRREKSLEVEMGDGDFPDPAFRSFCMEMGYADAEGNVSREVAATVTELDLCDRGIVSLQGIGYFTGLKVLDCSYNELTTFDAAACPGLTELDCAFNYLAELDVTACPGLEILSCSRNELRTLELAPGKALKELDCCYNHLPALDVIAHEGLEVLECTGNELRELKLPAAGALFTIACNHNHLAALDLRGMTSVDLYRDRETALIN